MSEVKENIITQMSHSLYCYKEYKITKFLKENAISVEVRDMQECLKFINQYSDKKTILGNVDLTGIQDTGDRTLIYSDVLEPTELILYNLEDVILEESTPEIIVGTDLNKPTNDNIVIKYTINIKKKSEDVTIYYITINHCIILVEHTKENK